MFLAGQQVREGIELRTIPDVLDGVVHVSGNVVPHDVGFSSGGWVLSTEHLEGGGLPCSVDS